MSIFWNALKEHPANRHGNWRRNIYQADGACVWVPHCGTCFSINIPLPFLSGTLSGRTSQLTCRPSATGPPTTCLPSQTSSTSLVFLPRVGYWTFCATHAHNALYLVVCHNRPWLSSSARQAIVVLYLCRKKQRVFCLCINLGEAHHQSILRANLTACSKTASFSHWYASWHISFFLPFSLPVEKYGPWFSFHDCPRAKMFRRDQGKVSVTDCCPRARLS